MQYHRCNLITDESLFHRRLFTLSAKPTGSASASGCFFRFEGVGKGGVAVSFFSVFRSVLSVEGEVGGTP